MTSPRRSVAIVGGGIIGASTAFFLARLARSRNLAIDITLVEGTAVAAGASGKAGGLLALDWHGSAPLSRPFSPLPPDAPSRHAQPRHRVPRRPLVQAPRRPRHRVRRRVEVRLPPARHPVRLGRLQHTEWQGATPEAPRGGRPLSLAQRRHRHRLGRPRCVPCPLAAPRVCVRVWTDDVLRERSQEARTRRRRSTRSSSPTSSSRPPKTSASASSTAPRRVSPAPPTARPTRSRSTRSARPSARRLPLRRPPPPRRATPPSPSPPRPPAPAPSPPRTSSSPPGPGQARSSPRWASPPRRAVRPTSAGAGRTRSCSARQRGGTCLPRRSLRASRRRVGMLSRRFTVSWVISFSLFLVEVEVSTRVGVERGACTTGPGGCLPPGANLAPCPPPNAIRTRARQSSH